MTSKHNKAPLLYYIKLCASFQIHWWIQTGVTVRKCSIRVKNGDFLSRVTLKFEGWSGKIRGHLFYTTFFCSISKYEGTSSILHSSAAFQSHWHIQTGVTAWKHSSRVKIGDFLSRVTLKIDVWTWKTIGHISYAASTFMHHFIANGEFKLELQSGNEQFGSKSTIFLAVWPWNLTDDLQEQ